MATTDLLARVKATRDQKSRMYDGELQALLAAVVAHLEGDAPLADPGPARFGNAASAIGSHLAAERMADELADAVLNHALR